MRVTSLGLRALAATVVVVALAGCAGSPEVLASQSPQENHSSGSEPGLAAESATSSGLTEADVQAIPDRLDQVTEALFSTGPTQLWSDVLEAYTGTLTTPEYREHNLSHVPGVDQLYTEDGLDQVVAMDVQILATHIAVYDWELQGDNTILFEPMASGSRKRVAFRQIDGIWLIDDIWLDGR